jgi:hypothetical protein
MAAAGVGHLYGIFKAYPTIGRFKTGAQAVQTMKLLVAAGGSLDGRTGELAAEFQKKPASGLTMAHGAAQQGWNEVLEYLHAQGSDIDAKTTSADAATPRDLAVAKEHPETAAFIDKLLAD